MKYSDLSRNLSRVREMAPWKMWRIIESTGDNLLYRQFILHREGRETLVNVIRGQHNLPNRY